MTEANTRPARADEVRQERRRHAGAVAMTGIKLTVDETKLDRNTYEYRWAKDFGSRVQQLHGDDWDPAPENAVIGSTSAGTTGTKIGGTDESGKPFDMVLLRKRKDWFKADQKDKQRPLDEMDAAIRGGTSRAEIEAGAKGDFYTPGTNSVQSTR